MHNSRHSPNLLCSFYLPEAAVWRPPRRAATKDTGKPQQTLFTALTKLGTAPVACPSNSVKKIEAWSQRKQRGGEDYDERQPAWRVEEDSVVLSSYIRDMKTYDGIALWKLNCELLFMFS